MERSEILRSDVEQTDLGNGEARWRDRIAATRRRGDHLATFDAACEGLAAHPASLALHYAAILALARSGATRGARDRLDRLRASGVLDDVADPALALDFAALDGRLGKDAWTRSEGATAREHAKASAEAYAGAFRRFATHYPAVNAATMFLAADDAQSARQFARHALDRAAAEPDDYWACASAAEAALILGDRDLAGEWLGRAAGIASGLDDVASTRRQVRLVADMTGEDPGVVDRLPAPPVRYWLDDEARQPAKQPASGGGAAARAEGGIAFGAVVTPNDVVRAERLLARGDEVVVVLPCEPPAWLDALGVFEADSVRLPLERLLETASNVVFVTREGRADDPAALDLCRRQVRGLARLRAETLAVAARRIVWRPDGTDDFESCSADGDLAPAARGPATWPEAGDRYAREPRAIVFGDVRGFSRLSEADQLQFLDRIMGGFADVLASEHAVDYVETAGDGIYVVLADVESAARCCFGLRDVLDPEHVAEAGLPPHLGLRLSAHVGPLYRRFDRVTGRHKFCGSEVIRTARIEPVTPLGEIYVTEQFAATLADAAGDAYACDYAGRQPMAKGFGSCRMYALRRSRA